MNNNKAQYVKSKLKSYLINRKFFLDKFKKGYNKKFIVSCIRTAFKRQEELDFFLKKCFFFRLDNLILISDFKNNIKINFIYQLIKHKHVLVNDHIIDKPYFLCRRKDVIKVKDFKSKSSNSFIIIKNKYRYFYDMIKNTNTKTVSNFSSFKGNKNFKINKLK
uniref:Small ribosomal protein 4 n=1 Tax=Pilostyles hamiltonii TaxID=448041 RepID=A0A0U3C0X5_9ROSI|nr:small ribosomal protein 4 [Pilostyles hamiltonii]ALT22442.1 small ribosomal protein 4 [Pilostyles hamiltonii]